MQPISWLVYLVYLVFASRYESLKYFINFEQIHAPNQKVFHSFTIQPYVVKMSIVKHEYISSYTSQLTWIEMYIQAMIF